MKPNHNKNLMKLRETLCIDDDHYCRACFQGGPHASEQNPPNVFRYQVADARPKFFLVFDKPNDNDRLKAKGLKWAPIEILDDRCPENQTRKNLVKLLNILGMINGSNLTPGVLSSPCFHITNAVKCDKCAETGFTGRVEINAAQAEHCKKSFFYQELRILRPDVLVMFGEKPDEYITGRKSKVWEVREESIDGQCYRVVRVPHTTDTSFNTRKNGDGGRAYKDRLPPDFWECDK